MRSLIRALASCTSIDMQAVSLSLCQHRCVCSCGFKVVAGVAARAWRNGEACKGHQAHGSLCTAKRCAAAAMAGPVTGERRMVVVVSERSSTELRYSSKPPLHAVRACGAVLYHRRVHALYGASAYHWALIAKHLLLLLGAWASGRVACGAAPPPWRSVAEPPSSYSCLSVGHVL